MEDNLTNMVGGYTALEGRWSRGRQVEILNSKLSLFNIYFAFFKIYVGDSFYLLASGWKWKIQKSTSENDKSAVEVIVIIFHVGSDINSIVGINVGSMT